MSRDDEAITFLGLAALGAASVLLFTRPAYAEPPPNGNGGGVLGESTGIYVPVYSDAMGEMVVQIKQAYPDLPVWANVNPASGPGDEFCSPNAPRNDIQLRINNFSTFRNMVISGYTGTWYAGSLDNPPTGSQWPGGCHFNVVYTVDPTQYSQLQAQGIPSILLQDAIDKYAGGWYTGINGLMMDEVYSGSNTQKQQWYKTAIDYARANGLVRIRGNPGTGAPLQYFQSGWFDSVSVYEGSGTFPSPTLIRSRTGGGVYAKKASLVSHNTPTISQNEIISMAPEVGYLYVTDDGGDGNPYDHPSSYIMNVAQWLDDYNRSIGSY